MADRSPLFLLLIFWTLSTGVFGAGETHVFSRSGKTVHLPCRNTDQHCRPETTWTYRRNRQTTTVEQNLSADCSLIISRVTAEDAGLYTCRKWRGYHMERHVTYSRVYLHVVAVSPSSSSSSSSSDIGPGLSLTLSCRLFSYSGLSCGDLFSSEDLHLSWVNEAGVDLNTDSRYQISSTGCIISLSTTLISEDEDKQWRCGVYQRNQLKTSDTFTVHYSAKGIRAPAVSPDHNTICEDPQSPNPAGSSTAAKAEAETFCVIKQQ